MKQVLGETQTKNKTIKLMCLGYVNDNALLHRHITPLNTLVSEMKQTSHRQKHMCTMA